jgi:peptide deformylase
MLNIITLGDEQLRKHSILVPDLNGTVHTLIEQMFESMREYKGIGLAAVQVGSLYRLFITEVGEDNAVSGTRNPEFRWSRLP